MIWGYTDGQKPTTCSVISVLGIAEYLISRDTELFLKYEYGLIGTGNKLHYIYSSGEKLVQYTSQQIYQ